MNPADIPLFVNVLLLGPTNEFEACAADLDSNGHINGEDIQSFLDCVLHDTCPPPVAPGKLSSSQNRATPASGTFTLHGRPIDVLSDGKTLIYIRARYYDPEHGRWLQRDPKGYVDGENLYESFGSNPTNRLDPRGTDDVISVGHDLVYQTRGFEYPFARGIIANGILTNHVLIDHAYWPFAFVMKRQDAMDMFDTFFGESDFHSTLEMMEKISQFAYQSLNRSKIVAVFPKESYRNYPGGWAQGVALDNDDLVRLNQLAQSGLQRSVEDMGQMTAVAFTASMGVLSIPGGVGAAAVDVLAAGADVVSGNEASDAGVVIITATVVGAALHLSFADDAMRMGRRGTAGRQLVFDFADDTPLAGTGPHMHIGGHHIHAKAAFKAHLNYDPNKGFAISEAYMKARDWRHTLMTTRQQKLFRELEHFNVE